MLENVKITKKFPFIIISFAITASFLIGLTAYYFAAQQLENAAISKLYSLLDSRKSALNAYFQMIEDDLRYQSQSITIRSSMIDFQSAWRGLPEPKKETLQTLYIDKNPFQSEQKSAYLDAGDDSLYTYIHTKYHPAFRHLSLTKKYYDAFLVDPFGNLLYSVRKEQDFATNLLKGQWKDTKLAELFRQINRNPVQGELRLTDFQPYLPSNNAPASFMGTAVFDALSNYIGVLIFQMPIEPMNDVMQVTAGMGETGEVFVVGRDLLMRSDSRFIEGRSILNTEVDTEAVNLALRGLSGTSVSEDYRGIVVFSAYAPFNFMGLDWVIIADTEKSEILAPLRKLGQILIAVGLVSCLVIFLIGYSLASDISNPIVAMTETMHRLARNELNININVSERQDEVGTMAKAMEVFKANAIERDKLQKKLSHMAHHDMLTGLPTRHLIMDRLKQITGEAERGNKMFAVMFADLDNFKSVNDSLGHHRGDEVIQATANILLESVREDDFVGRLGGDEFIVILKELDNVETAYRVADKLVKATARGLELMCHNLGVTLSLGVAIYPTDSRSAQDLIKMADKSMYVAKQNAKNQYFH
ncbi:GGDEF domain-containing protein [Veronia nyctiphanis]|uniref:GGDEF domain-containing protein n=1 Tax=Veronia nyctiphanis TaxID=1278244 RepID=A0A4Q0YMJ8_9GAMM|nr:diguanylate cyclase [Veronia nyctiphanis]RXJ72092.1 GGDEF domain-containing protein [Veronia nyctiphanis]